MSIKFPMPEGSPSGYYSNKNPLFPPIDRGADAIHSGNNGLHTNIITWKRKNGAVKWSTVPILDTDGVYSFYSHIYSGTARVIVDKEGGVSEFTTVGETSFYTKPSTSRMAFTSVKDTLYFTSLATDASFHDRSQRKRIGSATSSKTWGIIGPTVLPTFVIDDDTTGARIRIGWKYKYAYKDSIDGHVSSSSPPSVSTGSNLNVIWEISVQGSDNPRVDKISIFRTRDGGSTYQFLKDITNTGTGTITTTDQEPDSGLNADILAPSEDDNDPPPAMSDVTYHAGRIWGISRDTVRCNLNSLDRVTINGIQEECWPILGHEFPFNAPVKVESSSSGLMVFTRDGIHIITGKSADDFDPDILYGGLGIAQRRAVAKDGDTFYIFTSQKQVVKIGETVEVISQPLSDADLESFDPTTVELTVFRQGTEASLYICNGDDTTTRILRYSLNVGTWSTPWTANESNFSYGAIKAIETAVGEWNLLIAPRPNMNGYIWKESTTDRREDGTAYQWNIRGHITIAELGSIAGLRNITTESAVTAPTVTLLTQAISGTTASGVTVVPEPPILTDTTTLISKRHYPSTTNQVLQCRHFDYDLAWDAANDASELYGLGFEYDREGDDREGDQD